MAAAPSPTPFKISIPQDALDSAYAKLAATTLPPPPPPTDDPWHYGVPHADMVHLLEYWKTTYNWRVHETALNAALPQYTLPVPVRNHGFLQAHFVHAKAQRKAGRRAIPLLFLHGWPGNFLEARKIVPLLTNPESEDDLAFDVVAPSLPGFGFSGAPEKSGFAIAQYAEFAHNLMVTLGYQEYVVQAGDWGFAIAHRIVHLYGPTHVKAWHTNSPYHARAPAPIWHPWLYLLHLVTPYTEEDKRGLAYMAQWNREGRAYYDIQATTPQTVAYALADSPVGLLAWLYEKLVRWSGDYPWTEDEVLTWMHIYLFGGTQSTASVGASMRIYFEASHANDLATWSNSRFYNGDVPLGVSTFIQDGSVVPDFWHHTLGKVVYSKRQPAGGHFAAYEKPAELVADIRSTFKLPGVLGKFT